MLHLSRAHILRLTQRSYTTAPPPTRRLSSALRTSLYAAGTLALVAYYYDSRSALHEHVLMPAVRAVTDAETSHKLAVELLSLGAWARPRDKGTDGEVVRAEMWGKEVVNPVGVAAGFDKDARAIDGESGDTSGASEQTGDERTPSIFRTGTATSLRARIPPRSELTSRHRTVRPRIRLRGSRKHHPGSPGTSLPLLIFPNSTLHRSRETRNLASSASRKTRRASTDTGSTLSATDMPCISCKPESVISHGTIRPSSLNPSR